VTSQYGRLPKLPTVPGLGAGVTGLQVGQCVNPLSVAGTWQGYVIANPAQLVPLPDEVSNQTAAQFVVNPVADLSGARLSYSYFLSPRSFAIATNVLTLLSFVSLLAFAI
jgi:hypothetical protein